LKKILIISPHYPPSNLAAVHRSRLFAQHLPTFGWKPYILTVDEKFYEEKLDWNLTKLLPSDQNITKVNAFKITKPRLIGDIGLRAFFQLRRSAYNLVLNENIDFVYIPIPSYYVALIGPYLYKSLGVKYGIDYIDPWVHDFPGSQNLFTRHWFSKILSKYLEPKALKHVSLITGVAKGYYQGVLHRNSELINSCLFGAMPYGGELTDHLVVNDMHLKPYLLNDSNKIKLVYAGAFLPKAYLPIELFFQTVKDSPDLFDDVEIYFIGSGKTPNDANGYNIKHIAEKYGLWKKQIFEFPERIPYLDVLVHIDAADGVFILGSTEPHYTPSKVYQAVLSSKPIFAILHELSSAASIIEQTKSGLVLKITEEKLHFQKEELLNLFTDFKKLINTFSPNTDDLKKFERYSAKNITSELVALLNQIIK
jgi:hypothetical protein